MELLEDAGADAVRWAFYTQGQPWNNLGMTPGIAKETYKNFFGSLYNTYAFYMLYAGIDSFDPYKTAEKFGLSPLPEEKQNVMDRWIKTKLKETANYVSQQLDTFHSTEASRKIQDFVDNLSNWYIRRCRERFWVGDMTQDKFEAFSTLHFVLVGLAKILAPFCPFIAEEIYQNIERPFNENAKESVHLCAWPELENINIDEKLLSDMELVYSYAELGRSARTLSNLKIRQPLSKLYLTDAQNQTTLSSELVEILKDELNVKEVVQNSNLDEFVSYSLKPQLKTLGPKYGKQLGEIREFFASCNADEIVKTVRSGNSYTTHLTGGDVVLTEADLLIAIEQKEGFVSSTENHLAVIFDAHLTDALLEEGFIRELISKIQALRKSSGFNVVDRIVLTINADEKTTSVIMKNKELVFDGCLCVDIISGETKEMSDEVSANSFSAKFSIEKK